MTKLENTINNYFKKHKEVVAVYLFGSHAKRQERRLSDVDLGIVMQHSALPRSLEFQSQYIVDLGRLLRKDIHAVILNTAGELLLKQVFRSGHLICNNNEDQLKRFNMHKFSMIAEFGYYLEITRAGFVQSLRNSRGDRQNG